MRHETLTEGDWEKVLQYGFQEEFAKECECVLYQAGEKMIEEEGAIDKLFVMLDGLAKVCMSTPNGKNLILCYYVSQGLLGDMEYLQNVEEVEATVVAISEVKCLVIPYTLLRKYQKRNVKFFEKLAEEMAEKLMKSTENYVLSAVCMGEERLCHYILKNSHQRIFSDILTDVSCSIGMSYRHMFRLIGSLCEEKILEKRQNGYYILKPEELEKRAAYHS